MRLTKQDRALLQKVIDFIQEHKKEMKDHFSGFSGLCAFTRWIGVKNNSSWKKRKIFKKGERRRFIEIFKANIPNEKYFKRTAFYFRSYNWTLRINYLKQLLESGR